MLTKAEAWEALHKMREKADSEKWILDSGATKHMCGNWKEFTTLKKMPNPMTVTVGNGAELNCTHSGTVHFVNRDGANTKMIIFHDVLYVPGIKRNLISITQSL